MRTGRFWAAIAVVMVTLVGSTAVQAGVPIPCTGEKIILVQPVELPAEGDGQVRVPSPGKIGLGYLFTGCFSGRWITHVGSSSQYREGGEALLAMVAMANGGRVTAEPGLFGAMLKHPGAFWVEWLWVVLGTLIALATAFNAVAQNALAARGAPTDQMQLAGMPAGVDSAAAQAPGAGIARPARMPPRSASAGRGIDRPRQGTFGRR